MATKFDMVEYPKAKCSQCGEVEEYFICGLTMHEAKLIADTLRRARLDANFDIGTLTDERFNGLLANFEDVST